MTNQTDQLQGERADIVCSADEMDAALWYLHDHHMPISAESIMQRLAFIAAEPTRDMEESQR